MSDFQPQILYLGEGGVGHYPRAPISRYNYTEHRLCDVADSGVRATDAGHLQLGNTRTPVENWKL